MPLGDDGACSGDAIVRGDVGLLFFLLMVTAVALNDRFNES